MRCGVREGVAVGVWVGLGVLVGGVSAIVGVRVGVTVGVTVGPSATTDALGRSEMISSALAPTGPVAVTTTVLSPASIAELMSRLRSSLSRTPVVLNVRPLTRTRSSRTPGAPLSSKR